MYTKILFDEEKNLFCFAIYPDNPEKDINGVDIYTQLTGYFPNEEEARKDAEMYGYPIEEETGIFKTLVFPEPEPIEEEINE